MPATDLGNKRFYLKARAGALRCALLLLSRPPATTTTTRGCSIVVTASGTPPAVVALEVTLTRPRPDTSTNRYSARRTGTDHVPDDAQRAAARLRDRRRCSIDVDANDAAGTTVASGHGGPITIAAGRAPDRLRAPRLRRRRAASSTAGVGDADGGTPTPSPRCGNGRVDPGETCDTAIAPGDPGACPPSLRRPRPLHDATRPPAATAPSSAAARGDPRRGCRRRLLPGRRQPRRQQSGQRLLADLRQRRRRSGRDLRHRRSRPASPAPARSQPTARPAPPAPTRMLVSAGTCSAVCVRYPDRHASPARPATAAARPAPPTRSTTTARRRAATAWSRSGESVRRRHPAARAGRLPDELRRRRRRARIDYFSTSRLPGRACQHFPITTPGLRRRLLSCTGRNQHATDTDCPPMCGNGVVEPGETCDGDSCPTSCPLPPPAIVGTSPAACSRSSWATPIDCTARCVIERRSTACEPDRRGCCPAGCTSENDPDCSPLCGDGFVESTQGEECDIAALAARARPLPDLVRRTATRAPTIAWSAPAPAPRGACHLPITALRPGDGCCPPAAAATSMLDPDCPPVCGNGVVEQPDRALRLRRSAARARAREACPTQRSPAPATSVQGGADTCSATCVATPITDCVERRRLLPAGLHRRRRQRLPGDLRRRRGREPARTATARSPRASRAPARAPATTATPARSTSRRGRPRAARGPAATSRITGCVAGRRLLPARLLRPPTTATAPRAAATGGSARARPAIRPAPARPPARTTAIRARPSS